MTNLSPIFCRITKVDEKRREVTGRATQEAVDRDGEIMDYATTKPEFMKWSAEVSADTGGKSLGNVRSMHGNVAAGKLTNIDFNDVEKAIDVTAKIVDPVEWDKVLEGVHTGFSIGGRYARKWAEPIAGKMVTRYTAVPSEISIVDRPCCPTAKFFTIHKHDGSVVKREFAWTHELTLIDGKLALVEKGTDDMIEKGGPGSGRHKGDGASGGITAANGIKNNDEAGRMRMEQSQRMQDDASRNSGDKHGAEGVAVADAAAAATHHAEESGTKEAHVAAASAHRAAANFHYDKKGVSNVQGMWRPQQHELIARSHMREASNSK